MNITGKIIDNKGEPLTGANVYISDSSGKVINPPTGSTADIDGNYKINANVGDFLTASFVGQKKQTIKVGSVTTQNFTLPQSDSATLATVDVIAHKDSPPNPIITKAKMPTGIIIFASLAGLLLIAGGVIQFNQRKA